MAFSKAMHTATIIIIIIIAISLLTPVSCHRVYQLHCFNFNYSNYYYSVLFSLVLLTNSFALGSLFLYASFRVLILVYCFVLVLGHTLIKMTIKLIILITVID
jgi:hypothetical protein